MSRLARKPALVVIAVLLVLVVGPVLVKQVLHGGGRGMTGVPLRELIHTEVAFRNSRQNIDLAGLLFVPPGPGPFPAAVLIHGSGTSSRTNGWYSTLTHDLVEQGILVLLPDKRGSEASGGDWRTSSFEDLATDTLAAVEYLDAREDLPISRIGVVGMSQGGWIAPVAASRSTVIDFVVSFAGSVVTPPEQLVYEETHNLRQLGFLPGVSDAIARLSSLWIRRVAQSGFWEKIGDFEPIGYWEALDADALLLFGAADTNVPTAESVARIRALGNPRLRVRVFEGSGHALEEPPDVGDRIVRRDASDAIAEFVRGAGGGS